MPEVFLAAAATAVFLLSVYVTGRLSSRARSGDFVPATGERSERGVVRVLEFFRLAIVAAVVLLNWMLLAMFLSVFGASDTAAGWGAMLVEAALAALAFTPAGEAYFRALNRLRRPLPDEESVLRRLFEKVCARCGVASIPDLYVSDDPYPNACAVGKKTVGVSRGLLARASEAEVEAVLAHELGHLANGDTKVLLAAYVMNAVGGLAVWIVTGAMALLSAFSFAAGGATGDRHMFGLGWFVVLLAWVLRAATWALQKVLHLSFLAVGRVREYEADAYAARNGYRDGLVSWLSRHVEPGPPRGLAAALVSSHPPADARVERLMRRA